jgi:hypothetical protein
MGELQQRRPVTLNHPAWLALQSAVEKKETRAGNPGFILLCL